MEIQILEIIIFRIRIKIIVGEEKINGHIKYLSQLLIKLKKKLSLNMKINKKIKNTIIMFIFWAR